MAEFKFFCPQCGQHIQCDTSYAGQQINCPVCQQVIAVPHPPRAASAVSLPVAVKPRVLRNVLVAATAMAVLAGLVVGGWYGYSKFKFRKFPPGLVALWSGNGNGNDSVGGHNATVPSGITYAPGKIGQGFNFDGQENRIIVPDAPDLNFGDHQDFSITAWIKPLKSATTYGVMSIVDKRFQNGADESAGYEFPVVNGRICTRILRTGFGPAGPDMRDGQFHQVALTVQRDSPVGGHLYVDGKSVLTFDTTALVGDVSNDQPLRIGNHCEPTINCFFKGIINQVAIYKRALSAGEIRKNFDADNNN